MINWDTICLLDCDTDNHVTCNFQHHIQHPTYHKFPPKILMNNQLNMDIVEVKTDGGQFECWNASASVEVPVLYEHLITTVLCPHYMYILYCSIGSHCQQRKLGVMTNAEYWNLYHFYKDWQHHLNKKSNYKSNYTSFYNIHLSVSRNSPKEDYA